jgi:hypothetical protein
MSTTRLTRSGFPRLGTIEVSKGTHVWRLVGGAVRRAAVDLRSVPRYVVRYSVFVLALVGLMALLDARGDGPIPVMFPLMDPGKSPHRISSAACAVPGVGNEDRWRGLAPALAILDDVNPQVADWVRRRHGDGDLLFSDRFSHGRDRQGSLARYDSFRRTLLVQRALFEEKDGEIAAILCHEYRHSRQSTAKVAKCALSFVVSTEGDRSILENDALLYEHEARLAIFRQ